MTTAEALAVVREALEPRTGETLYADHPKVRGLAALALIEERVEELEAFRLRGNARRLAEAEAERDEYRFWNERVRVCSEHTAEVADGSDDCLVCRVAELETALREGGCQFGCGPYPFDSGQVGEGVGIVPACPIHGWVCVLLDAADARAEKAEAERDNATAALERMRLELVRVDGMVSRYSQSADAVSEDRARWMERCAELEAALEIEREGNPHRVYCPKCQADLPCESCKRYAVALPAAEERVVELEAALREIEEMERERDIYREAEEMRVIARRALGGGE